MQKCSDSLKTQRKHYPSLVTRSKSAEPTISELNVAEMKILLTQAAARPDYQLATLRQDLLISKKLFNPFRYFGSPHFDSVQQSSKFHQKHLDAMFCMSRLPTRRSHEKIILKASKDKKEGELPTTVKDVFMTVKEAKTGSQAMRSTFFRKAVGNAGGNISEGSNGSDCTVVSKGSSKSTARRGEACSPKKYVKQNKQNFQRLNLNSMQKVRLKLHLDKRQNRLGLN